MVGYVKGQLPASLNESSIKENFKCFIICALVTTATFQYGFDTGIMNGFQATQGFLRVFGEPGPEPGVFVIGTVFQQLITSLLQVGLICGSLLIGPFSRFFGRRAAIFLASTLAVIAVTIQITVTSKGPIYFARWLMGLANGFYVNLVVLYISETTPAHLRGALVSMFQPAVAFGSLISAIVSNAFSTKMTKVSYQAQLGILYAVPVWLAFYVLFIPESPRWLASRGHDDAAERSLKRLRGSHISPEALKEEITAIKESIVLERKLSMHTDWRDMFKGTNLRRTLLCMAGASFHPASGINFLIGYGTFFFQRAGTDKPFVDTIILQACGFALSLASIPIARAFGRRPILLTGFAVTTLTMLVVAILYTVAPHSSSAGKGMVAMVCLFNAAYGGSIGPISWVSAGEMPSNQLRSYTFGTGMAVGFVGAWLTVFTTASFLPSKISEPYFINASQLNWGPKIAWIWFPSNLITLIFIFFALPETKGRTLEELDELFLQRIPSRRFKYYKCVGIQPVDSDSGKDIAGIEPEYDADQRTK